MKLFIDGLEVELESDAEITRGSDRLSVRAPEGVFSAVAVRSGDTVLVSYQGRQFRIERKRSRGAGHQAAASGELRAPMPGQVVDVLVAQGDTVQKGDKLLVLEAMKTQQAFTAPFDGTVTSLPASRGLQVEDGALLAVIEEQRAD